MESGLEPTTTLWCLPSGVGISRYLGLQSVHVRASQMGDLEDKGKTERLDTAYVTPLETGRERLPTRW